jgi:hypothetical protein
MARPVTVRPTVRVQTAGRPQTPGLGVVQSLDVRTPGPEATGLGGLAQALGVLTQVGTAYKKSRDAEDRAQGMADQTLNKADQERIARSEAYADGVFEVSSLAHYQDAEKSVTEWAATELDHSLPVDQQVAAVDAKMKEQLGDLVQDPKARRVIAERYQKFIDSFSAQVVTGQAEARVKAAIDTAQADISASLKTTGTFNYSEHWARLTKINGDGTASTRELLRIVGEEAVRVAAEGGDYEAVLKQVPTEIVTESGQKLPSPLRSPENNAIILNARARAEKAKKEHDEPLYARREMDARVRFDAMLRDGQVITRGMVDEYQDVLSEAVRADYIDRSLQERTRRDAAAKEQAAIDAALEAAHNVAGSWLKSVGVPGGPDNEDQARKLADGSYRNILKTVPGYSGPESLTGRAIVQNESALNAVALLSAQENVPYTPLKNHMESVSTATPGFVIQNLPAYKVLSAAGLAHLYVSDDKSALLYEVALGASEAGENQAAIEQRIRDLGNKDTREYVSRESAKLKARDKSFEVPVVGNFFDASSSDLVNQAYIQARREALVAYALETNMSAEQADEFSKRRLLESHAFLPFGEKVLALPKTAVRDPEEAAKALQWWHEVKLPQYAKEAGVDPEMVRLVPTIGLNSRKPFFYVADEALALTDDFDLDQLIKAFRHYVPKVDPRKKVERRQDFLHTSDPNYKRPAAPRAGHE